MFSSASVWRRRSRAAVLAACLLVTGFAPASGLAQDGDLAARVKSLEAEIASLKIMVGTLESLLRATPPSALAQDDAATDAIDQDALDPRVSALETQIGALTHKIEEIGAQVTKLEAKLAAAPPATAPSAPHAAAPEAETLPPQMSALTEEEPAPEVAPQPEPAPQPEAATQNVDPRARWYGPKPGEEDDGSPKSIMPPGATTGALPDDMPQSFATLPDENAEALYKQGYGDYLRRDYAGAEKAFSQLVKDYPDDPLAGSAQYWVGETYYVRKQYQKAADTFLAGFRKYASGDKAPDSLLKLGMSLAALGDKDAACNTFKKLDDAFPEAPGDIRSQAKRERKKAGC